MTSWSMGKYLYAVIANIFLAPVVIFSYFLHNRVTGFYFLANRVIAHQDFAFYRSSTTHLPWGHYPYSFSSNDDDEIVNFVGWLDRLWTGYKDWYWWYWGPEHFKVHDMIILEIRPRNVNNLMDCWERIWWKPKHEQLFENVTSLGGPSPNGWGELFAAEVFSSDASAAYIVAEWNIVLVFFLLFIFFSVPISLVCFFVWRRFDLLQVRMFVNLVPGFLLLFVKFVNMLFWRFCSTGRFIVVLVWLNMFNPYGRFWVVLSNWFIKHRFFRFCFRISGLAFLIQFIRFCLGFFYYSLSLPYNRILIPAINFVWTRRLKLWDWVCRIYYFFFSSSDSRFGKQVTIWSLSAAAVANVYSLIMFLASPFLRVFRFFMCYYLHYFYRVVAEPHECLRVQMWNKYFGRWLRFQFFEDELFRHDVTRFMKALKTFLTTNLEDSSTIYSGRNWKHTEAGKALAANKKTHFQRTWEFVETWDFDVYFNGVLARREKRILDSEARRRAFIEKRFENQSLFTPVMRVSLKTVLFLAVMYPAANYLYPYTEDLFWWFADWFWGVYLLIFGGIGWWDEYELRDVFWEKVE
jgi:hypothetical protein